MTTANEPIEPNESNEPTEPSEPTEPTEPTEPNTRAVVRTADLDATLAYFKARLGFRLDRVFPADSPRVVELSREGFGIRIERVDPAELVPEECTIEAPFAPELVVARAADTSAWSEGRAGMQYRDLIPGRLGGRYIASHIRICTGGPVPDYVHFHDVAFQLIYVWKGEVTVAYEHEGAPRVYRSGDCLLQPPGIRHRVLECTAGLEVIEVASPAEHVTHVEHDLTLPHGTTPGREIGGQRFTHHAVEVERCSSGAVSVVEAAFTREWSSACRTELDLCVVLQGDGAWCLEAGGGAAIPFGVGDAVALPPGQSGKWQANSPVRVLRVTAPAVVD